MIPPMHRPPKGICFVSLMGLLCLVQLSLCGLDNTSATSMQITSDLDASASLDQISGTIDSDSSLSSSCNSTSYLHDGKICAPCTLVAANCLTCTQETCRSCSVGSTSTSPQCVNSTCGSGEYSTTSGECQTCSSKYDANCLTCDDTDCFSCQSGTNLDTANNQCIACLETEYWDGSECLSCGDRFHNCHSCTSVSCSTCISGSTDSDIPCSQPSSDTQTANSTQTTNDTQATNDTQTANDTLSSDDQTESSAEQQYELKVSQLSQKRLSIFSLFDKGRSQSLCSLESYYSLRELQCQPCQEGCQICISSLTCLLCAQGYINMLSSCILDNSSDQELSDLSASTEAIMDGTVTSDVTKTITKYPAARKLLYFSSQLFPNIDDLWFFSYHNVEYSLTISSIFDGIRNLESEKFNFLGEGFLSEMVLEIEEKFSHYIPYGKEKFTIIEEKNSGFFSNILEFCVFTVPQNIGLFLLLRLAFQLTSQYRVSIIFRPFSFNGFFLLSLFDGNIQYFFYISSNQIQQFFNFSVSDKAWNCLFIVLFFLCWQSCVALFFLLKYFYQKKMMGYFLDNTRETNAGIAYVVIYSGLRNISISTINSFWSENYERQILALILCDVVCMGCFLLLLAKFRCFLNATKFWITVSFPLMRITLEVAFYAFLRTPSSQDELLSVLAEKTHTVIFLVYFLVWLLSAVYLGGYLACEAIVDNFCKKKQNEDFEANELKQSPQNPSDEQNSCTGSAQQPLQIAEQNNVAQLTSQHRKRGLMYGKGEKKIVKFVAQSPPSLQQKSQSPFKAKSVKSKKGFLKSNQKIREQFRQRTDNLIVSVNNQLRE